MSEINGPAQVMMNDINDAVEQLNIQSHLIDWTSNIGVNLRRGRGHSIKDFTLPEDRKKETIFIVGAGPSMSQYRENLPKLRDVGTVVMSPTAYPWMSKIGLEPDVIVSVDKMYDQSEAILGAKCPVIAATLADPGLGAFDPYWFNCYHGDATPKHPIWGENNKIMFHLHQKALGSAHGWGSLGDVTNMAAQIFSDVIIGDCPFEGWGAKRLVFVGNDRSYWHGYERMMTYVKDPALRVELPPLQETRLTIEWRGTKTGWAMAQYVQMLYKWWVMPENIGVPLYRLDHGTMHEIPFVGLARILAGKYPKPLSPNTVEKRVRKFLDHEWLEVFPYTLGTKEDVEEMMRISTLKWQAMQEAKDG